MQTKCSGGVRLFSRLLKAAVLAVFWLATASPAGAGTVLTFWHFEVPPPRPQLIQEGLNAFEKETGIKVDQSPIPFPDFFPKLQAAVAADHLPDLIWIDTTHFAFLVNSGALAPLQDVFNAINAVDPLETSVSKLYQYQGVQYAIPVYGIAWPLVYRKDLYEAKGLKHPPETWADLEEAATKLNNPSGGVYGMAVPYSTKGRYGGQVVWPFVRGNGGDVVDWVGGKWQVVFNSPRTVEAYTYLAKMTKFSPPGSADMDWDMATRLLRGGQLANVMYTPDWVPVVAEENPKLMENYITALMPKPHKDSPPTPHTGYFRGWVVTKRAEKQGHMEAAAKLLKWMYQPKHMAQYVLNAAKFHFNPLSPGAAAEYKKLPAIQKFARIVDVQVQAIKTVSIIGLVGDKLCPAAAALEASNVVGETLQKIVLSGWSPERGVKWGHEEFEKILKEQVK